MLLLLGASIAAAVDTATRRLHTLDAAAVIRRLQTIHAAASRRFQTPLLAAKRLLPCMILSTPPPAVL